MSASKDFYHDCAMAGFIPLDNDSFRRLEELEDQLDLAWVAYMEHPYLGFDDKEYQADGISIESGYSLQGIGVSIDAIDDFLDCFVDREGSRWRAVVDRYWTSERLYGKEVA